jgi:hypothetical protein
MSAHRRIPASHAWSCVATGLACVLQAAWATADPPVAGPLGSGASVLLEPAPAPANPRRQRAVFVCQDNDVPVYADRPCGSGTTARSLVVATPPAGAAATTSPPKPRASTRPRPANGTAGVQTPPVAANQCMRLQQRLDALNDRMRAGYSAREAARLWQQWRDAKERMRAARC